MRLLASLFSFAVLLGLTCLFGVFLLFTHYSENLPDYGYLKDYRPPTLTRFYADDGRMLATIAAEQRVFVPMAAMPKRVVGAFLSAEDNKFYEHNGVDVLGIFRAALSNLQNIGHGKRPAGASTITQQVAKNMLLSNKVSIERKVREIILANLLERSLSKDRILEIYLNEIFLGRRSYGVATAALNYFNKSLDELTVAEAAFLAALPKGPNNYDPERNQGPAIERRNWVLSRMAETGRLSPDEAQAAQKESLTTRARDETETASGGAYFAEEVRRQLVAQFGEKTVLEGGLAVKTSLDPVMQKAARKYLREGLVSYDRQARGFRGPLAHLETVRGGLERLKKISRPPGGEDWPLALVVGLSAKAAEIILADGSRGAIPWTELSWARKEDKEGALGPPVTKPADVLSIGDVVSVEQIFSATETKTSSPNAFTLRQVPLAQGALVALDPHTGRVFAMVGGFSDKISQYNRATQALRQPGSAFKPFVYLAALDKGFTPSSLVLDAPFEYVQGPGLPLWRPENYSQEFYGPTPLRVGIEKSRNVMTVRLANAIGMDAVVAMAKKFDIADDMPALLSFSLGAKETTPLRLAAAYGMIVNGGRKISASLIDRIQDRDGKTVWRADQRPCAECVTPLWFGDMSPPEVPDTREQIQDSRTAYQMTSMLEGVVKRGTGQRLAALPFPVAGKTGTTNESRDAWFVGFTPDLVCAVYVGFDEPRSLGSHETGSSVAVPIFKNFMEEALQGKPAVLFRVPPGLRMVRVDPATGALAQANDKRALWEAFLPGTEPQEGVPRTVLDGSVTGEYAGGVSQFDGANDDQDPTIVEGAPSSLAEEPARAPFQETPGSQGTGGLY